MRRPHPEKIRIAHQTSIAAGLSFPAAFWHIPIKFTNLGTHMTKHRSAGFTLIELSIAIVIIGLMTASLFSGLKARMAGQEQRTTVANLRAANLALKSYLAMNDAYPCPASRLALKGTPDYGKAMEECQTETKRLLSTRDPETITAPGRGDRPVRIGILPFRSLGLPDVAAVDGWGNLLQYAVTESLTDPLLYDQESGAIDVIAEDRLSRVTPPGSVQYVVFSTGPDGLRGWAASGAPTAMPCPEENLQTENCNDDAVFMETETRYENGKTVYDDRVTYLQYDPEKIPAGGLLFYYAGSCPAGFFPVDVGGQHVGGIETLRKVLPGRDNGNDSGSKKNVCYSPRYASTMMIGVEDRDKPPPCPSGWNNIGYRAFGNEAESPVDSVFYQFCAR